MIRLLGSLTRPSALEQDRKALAETKLEKELRDNLKMGGQLMESMVVSLRQAFKLQLMPTLQQQVKT